MNLLRVLTKLLHIFSYFHYIHHIDYFLERNTSGLKSFLNSLRYRQMEQKQFYFYVLVCNNNC
ncbi:hypothetical protein Hanom_Chr16g01451901 [Helianthus anomalus]